MAAAGRSDSRGLLTARRIRVRAACFLCVLYVLSVLSGCAAAGPHFENIEDRADAIGNLNLYTLADMAFLAAIKNAMEDTAAEDKKLYDAEQRNWVMDHLPLTGVTPRDVKEINDEIRALYDGLSDAGALSFAEAADIERSRLQDPDGYKNPAYGEAPGGPFVDFSLVDFSDAYEIRAGNWQDYIRGFLNANRLEAKSLVESQKRIEGMRDAYMGFPIAYRKTLQGGQPIDNFTNQQLSRLRIDIQRYLDLEVTQALNEQQERADAQAAFDWAVRKEARNGWRQSGLNHAGY